MQRYSTFGPTDSPSMQDGDIGFVGADQYTVPANLPPGVVQDAVNCDFSNSAAESRKGFVCRPETSSTSLGLTWSSHFFTGSGTNWNSIAYGNGRFVAVPASGIAQTAMSSDNGSTWTFTAITPPANNDSLMDVVHGNSLFVACTGTGTSSTQRILTSPDGVTWTYRTTPDEDYYTICYGGGQFVAISPDVTANGVITSPDGITWTGRTSAAANTWYGLVYGGGKYVAVGASGTGNRVMTSIDGITWTARTSAADYQWLGVAYGNGVYVAVAYDGVANGIMTSPDGETWTLRSPGVTDTWSDIAFGDGQFVAIGPTTSITSRNGIEWTQRAYTTTGDWLATAYGNDYFVAIQYSLPSNTTCGKARTQKILASGTYSDPDDLGARWIMLVSADTVRFYAFGNTTRTVSINSSYLVTEPSTVVQANNAVYIFRGEDETPLYWDGNWAGEFTVAATPTPTAGFSIIPNSNQATYHQNRLWVKDGKDTVAASGLLDFTAFDDLSASFTTDFGSSDYVVTTYPFGIATLLVFKNRSIFALTNTDGAVSDVTSTEITRQVGCVGKDAVVSVGPDVVYMSDRNINLLTLTAESNALQHKTLPLSRAITKIFKRVNWNYAYKVSMGYWDNKLYVALPLDNATTCSSVVVYNFLTEQWYGEWNFNASIVMNIQGWQVANYLGEQRLHAIAEDGRIFVTDEGPLDVSGTIFAEISSSFTTRAYRFDNENRVSRRWFLDIGTWRPSFTVTAYVDGVAESEEILSDQTFSRSDSWIFNDSTYALANTGDNYNRAFRKDYSGLPSESIQCQSGFYPEYLQEIRLPLLSRRKGRLSWLKVENAQGKLVVYGAGNEARAGDRGNLIQVG